MFNIGDLIKLKKSYKGFVYYDMNISSLIEILDRKKESNLFQYRKFIDQCEINFLILEKEKYFPNKISAEGDLYIYSVLNNDKIISLTDLDDEVTVEFCFYKV